MTKKEILIKEIEQIPEVFFKEVLDFIRSLQTKTVRDKISTASLSESSLAKDWLKPDEDKAWQNL